MRAAGAYSSTAAGIRGELGMVGAHRGVDPAPVEEAAQDRDDAPRPPCRRDRGVSDLPRQLVSKTQGVAVVNEKPSLHARVDPVLAVAQRLAKDRDGSTI